MITSDNGIVDELVVRFGHSEISKSSLIMALHYHFKECLSSGKSNINFIESKINELTAKGALTTNKGQKYKIM